MPATMNIPNCDITMLARIIEPEKGNLPLAAARAFLKFDFSQPDRDRMHTLREKAGAGLITDAEQRELDDYDRVGNLLDALRSKARKTLRKHTNGR